MWPGILNNVGSVQLPIAASWCVTVTLCLILRVRWVLLSLSFTLREVLVKISMQISYSYKIILNDVFKKIEWLSIFIHLSSVYTYFLAISEVFRWHDFHLNMLTMQFLPLPFPASVSPPNGRWQLGNSDYKTNIISLC